MTMHHIQDVGAMFMKFYRMLDDGGFIAISNVDQEDDSFHIEKDGGFHFGFDRSEIAKKLGAVLRVYLYQYLAL